MNSLKINIITRVTRPHNLPQIRSSIFDQIPDGVSVEWHIIYDTAKVESVKTEDLFNLQCDRTHFYFARCGSWTCQYQKVNEMLLNGTIRDGYVYLVDDDNILHPDFYREILSHWVQNPEINGFIFSQQVDGKDFSKLDVRRASPENIRVGGIDLAQYMFRAEIPNKHGVWFGTGYCGDGDFAIDLFKSGAGSGFKFIDQVLCYYNYIS